MTPVLCALLIFIAGASSKIIDNDISDEAPDPKLMQCAYIAYTVELCGVVSNFPYCNGTISPLMNCTVKMMAPLRNCSYPLMRWIIETKAAVFYTSDAVLCKTSLYKQFEADKKCWNIAKSGMLAITRVIPGLLTRAGCRGARLVNDITIGLGNNISSACAKNIQSYLNPLFDKTFCGKVRKD